MSTGRTTDDRDMDDRRYKSLKSVLDDVHRRLVRIEETLEDLRTRQDPNRYNPEAGEWQS